MNLARQAYWFEDRKEWALDTMACFQGMTTEQTMKVLRGDASIKGVDNIEFMDEPDTKFKAELAKHNKWLADKETARLEFIVEERRQEEIIFELKEKWDTDKLNTLDEENRRTALMNRADETHGLFFSGKPEKPQELTPPKSPVKLGKFVVEKQVLDDYIELAVSHDLVKPGELGAALYYSGRMMRVHTILRQSVGLEGAWGRNEKTGEPDEFDTALRKQVDEALKNDKRYQGQERIREHTRYDERQTQLRQRGLTAADVEKLAAVGQPYNPEQDDHPGD